LGIVIDAQVQAPGHGKWWLDGKTGSNKRYCQQCMCAINTPEEADGGKKMMSAKWVNQNGVAVAMSPAAECVRMLSDPSRTNRIKSNGMRAKQEGTALVKRNNYATYSMKDVPPVPEYEIEMEKGKYNGICVYYNICTDPDLGIRWAAVRRVACRCGLCKAQLKMQWVPRVDRRAQPRYAQTIGASCGHHMRARKIGGFASLSHGQWRMRGIVGVNERRSYCNGSVRLPDDTGGQGRCSSYNS
jgi:hypothetical protein